MTEELSNAIAIAKHYAGVALRADERGEGSANLCAKARDALRAAMSIARSEQPKAVEASIDDDWDGFWAEVAMPSAAETARDELSKLEDQVLVVLRRLTYTA